MDEGHTANTARWLAIRRIGASVGHAVGGESRAFGARGGLVTSDDASALDWPAELQRPFQIIAFDWDGTAVVDRSEDASAVRDRLESLLRVGVRIVVVSGTNLNNIDQQLAASITGPHKSRLFLCTNRGSEVYGFDAASRPVARYRRVATAEEDRALSIAADSLRDRLLARSGLEVRVIYDRLNRRKIDLIPLAEWSDPPKSEIGALRRATESRLHHASLSGGLAEVVAMARQAAFASGLTAARITSDAKHIEIGLTDKSDSMSWIMRELAQPNGVPARDVLVGGDEFGPVAACPGSDSLMMVPAASGAVFLSVGPEPYGLPPGVLHLPGGPARFREVLDLQIGNWSSGGELV